MHPLISLVLFALVYAPVTSQAAEKPVCNSQNSLAEISANRAVDIVRNSPALLKTLKVAEQIETLAMAWEIDPGATEVAIFEMAKSSTKYGLKSFPESQRDDILQETFIKIGESIRRCGFGNVFSSAIVSVYSTTAYNIALTKRRRLHNKDVSVSALDVHSDGWFLDQIPDRPGDIDQILRDQFKAVFEEALLTLPEKQQKALRLFYEGKTQAEITTTLESNQNATYKLIHDAKKKMRKELEIRGIDASFFDQ